MTYESKRNIQLPVLCYKCYEWKLRTNQHFRNCKEYVHMTSEKRRELISKTKEKCWAKRHQESNSSITKSLSDEDKANAFVCRSKSNTNILPVLDKPSSEYTPHNAKKLARALLKKCCIPENDYFTIYYKSVDELLQDFRDSLTNFDPDMANQHINQVNAVWSAIDKHMFPTITLKSYHPLRDRYHRRKMKTLGGKHGVAPGTLCSRFCSLGQFVQFFDLTRDDIVQVERTLSDFTKELNPLMRQREIDVPKNKLRNLLTTSHFICYGNREYIQKVI